MSVVLKKVLQSEKSILKNLYQLYLHDLSNYSSTLDITEEGSFPFEDLDMFWETDGLSPYFIKQDDRIIGFILLLERPFLKRGNDFGVNDLFILNKYKGKGMARQALEKLFQQKHGKYFVIQLIENSPAVSFWKKLYQSLNIPYEVRQEVVDGEHCIIQTFSI